MHEQCSTVVNSPPECAAVSFSEFGNEKSCPHSKTTTDVIWKQFKTSNLMTNSMTEREDKTASGVVRRVTKMVTSIYPVICVITFSTRKTRLGFFVVEERSCLDLQVQGLVKFHNAGKSLAGVSRSKWIYVQRTCSEQN